jgi:protease PrsW
MYKNAKIFISYFDRTFMEIPSLIFALLGGIVPAFIWLMFWLREDREHPEPKKYIALTFIFGMLTVPVVMIIQLVINNQLIGALRIEDAVKAIPFWGILAVIVLATSEEIVKYVAAYQGGLKRKTDDEPLDDAVYMICAALGFAAIENALFLFGPILSGNTELIIITGNMRFIGATLLHVACSAIIGIFKGFSHFKFKRMKIEYLTAGFFVAIVLHAAFNLFIIIHDNAMFIALIVVWLVIVSIIFIFEKLKKVHLEKVTKIKKQNV